ncbi:uncharacterized protein B0T15DRAFT_14117 [Chaetomium strumarium]|uniref:Uncharacterized protein n=1 Tax=Chaetomium strumarium TaxID=1170767 RepID=A0AAJ0M5M1_9PEZI|nr:hypothetical protein B0T15DRAFT_14117 [Chaetomium strumarium]
MAISPGHRAQPRGGICTHSPSPVTHLTLVAAEGGSQRKNGKKKATRTGGWALASPPSLCMIDPCRLEEELTPCIVNPNARFIVDPKAQSKYKHCNRCGACRLPNRPRSWPLSPQQREPYLSTPGLLLRQQDTNITSSFSHHPSKTNEGTYFNMSVSKPTEMRHEKSNKAEATAPTTDTSAGETTSNTHGPSKTHEAPRYICDCKICICGAAVDYPGDVCATCIKYH